MTPDAIQEIINRFEDGKKIATGNQAEYSIEQYAEMRALAEHYANAFFPDDKNLKSYFSDSSLAPTPGEWNRSRQLLIVILISLIEKLKQKKIEEETSLQSSVQMNQQILFRTVSFSNEAVEHSKLALVWIGLFVALFLVFMITLFCTFNCNEKFVEITCNVLQKLGAEKMANVNTVISFEYGRYIFFRLLTTSMFIYGLVVCIKNYNAHMHNRIVNQHRSNSLSVAVSMVENASPETKNHVLILVSKAIFEHQQTGYQGKDAEPTNPNFVGSMIEKS